MRRRNVLTKLSGCLRDISELLLLNVIDTLRLSLRLPGLLVRAHEVISTVYVTYTVVVFIVA